MAAVLGGGGVADGFGGGVPVANVIVIPVLIEWIDGVVTVAGKAIAGIIACGEHGVLNHIPDECQILKKHDLKTPPIF